MEADRAREKLNGTIVEGRKIEVRTKHPAAISLIDTPVCISVSFSSSSRHYIWSLCFQQVNNATARVVTKKPQTPVVNEEVSGKGTF